MEKNIDTPNAWSRSHNMISSESTPSTSRDSSISSSNILNDDAISESSSSAKSNTTFFKKHSSHFAASVKNLSKKNHSTNKLGTFFGVFLPCLQSILGVILFLRLPYITAQAGTIMCTVIIFICTMSTVFTVLSLSVIATNGIIQAGGPYYVISRTLGPGIGSSIGLLFYLGNTLSTSMFVLGAVETFQSTAISYLISFYPGLETQVLSCVLVFIITTVVSVGREYISTTSSLILLVVLVSIASIVFGSLLFAFGVYNGNLTDGDRVYNDNLYPRLVTDQVTDIEYDFTALIALFYPSVTGVMTGSNKSAVLANPAHSIPVGTFGAMFVTTIIYMIIVWLVGSCVANVTLRNDKLVLAALAWPLLHLVRLGIITSCIGAALQSLSSATLLISAMANDETVPLLRCCKPPRNVAHSQQALWITGFFAALPTLLGNIDHITPLVTMFFLLMYAGINLSCFLLSFLKTPGFRPTFKFHWSISLMGFAWCLGLALAISLPTALVTFSLFFILLWYSQSHASNKDFGDVGNSLRYTIVTNFLRAMAGSAASQDFAKNWRPQVLTILEGVNFHEKLHLLSLASQLQDKGGGINVVAAILPSKDSIAHFETSQKIKNTRAWLRHEMQSEGMKGAFAQVFFSSENSYCDAIWSSVIHSGLGPVSPNTVLISWFEAWRQNPKEAREYTRMLLGIMNLNKALILMKGTSLSYPKSNTKLAHAVIDIWWIVHDGGLLLLLPYLLSRNKTWKSNVALRLFACVTTSTENPEKLQEAVIEHLAGVRIKAIVKVINLNDTDIADHMRNTELNITRNLDRTSSVLDIAESNTKHMTVGEVFSQEVYEVPYQSLGDLAMEGMSDQPIYTFSNMKIGNTTVVEDEISSSSGSGHSLSSKLNTAKMFNKLMRQHSANSNLVISNMPLLKMAENHIEDRCSNVDVESNLELVFMEYVDAMCKGIDNILLIRGTGSEVITTYA